MKRHANIYLKKGLIGIVTVLLVLLYPANAFVLGATDDGSGSPATTTGPTKPNGADGKTYAYNKDTGMWENDRYIWDPVTKQTQPKTARDYSYNPETKMWDTTKWRYDAAAGKYVPNVVSVSTPTLPADTQTVEPVTDTVASEAKAAAVATSDLSESDPSSPTVQTTGESGHAYDLFYNASISNQFNSSAYTGNASAISNTLVGNAASGDALALSNLINVLQSSWSPADGQLLTFSSDIQGNVVGDLMIDPGQLAASNASTPSNLDVKASSSASIDNNVALAAGSGNVAVAGNTSAGDATSGSANAVANIVNLLNSAIGAHQSFLGVVNIWGNLDGDILLPPEVLNTLLASNATSAASATPCCNGNGNLNATFASSQAINNNVSASATTGTADVTHNTSAGNATSGNAATNVTLLNLTGRQVVGSDALLVFVNVLGKWVGLIVNAPTGSTSAALGGGITENSGLPVGDADINSTDTQTINNNVLVNAASGNVLARNNTSVGNATSGNATASVNIANLINTNLSLSNWFGILFINVFGNWTGSFGINTTAGGAPATGGMGGGSPTTTSVASTTPPQVFKFVPTGTSSYTVAATDVNVTPTNNSSDEFQEEDTYVTTTTDDSSGTPVATVYDGKSNWILPLIAMGVGAALLGTEQVTGYYRRRSRHTYKYFARSGSMEFIEPFRN